MIEAIMKALSKKGRKFIEGHEIDIKILLKLALETTTNFKMIHQAEETKRLLSLIKIPAYGSYHSEITSAILYGNIPGIDKNIRHQMYGAYMMAVIYLINIQGYTDIEEDSPVTEQPPETQTTPLQPSSTRTHPHGEQSNTVSTDDDLDHY